MDIFAQVEKKYKDDFEKLMERRFHFASRLYLWTNDEFSKNKLQDLKSEYIGTKSEEYDQIIETILRKNSSSENSLFYSEREEFFLKYPLLKKYNKILFKNLFCQTIYGFSLQENIEKYVSREDFIQLRKDLYDDGVAIAALSTYAINYFYALDFYLQEEIFYGNPNYFLDIVENEKIFLSPKTISLKIYLLTHAIIGESAFYAKGITRNVPLYEQMLAKIEEIIESEYENISLDSKVEFLVCVRICQKSTYLFDKILAELIESFDGERCYFSENGKFEKGDSFKRGEHRNVLALMAYHLNRAR
jgi:hypothetical protein